jgi:hypothetical protein
MRRTPRFCNASEKGHPREHGDVFEVKVPDLGKIERRPKRERAPGRVGQKSWQGNAPKITLLENFPDGWARAIALQTLFLTGRDVVAFRIRERGMYCRRPIERQPEHGPNQTDGTGDDEGGLPVVHEDGPGHERGREHGADGGADVENAASQAAFVGGEPFRRGLHAGGIGAALRKTQQPAQAREHLPIGGQAMRHTDERPCDGEDGEADFQSQHIEHVTTNRLEHDAALKGGHDLRILPVRDAEVVHQGGRGDGQGAAREIIHDRTKHQQADDPPAEAMDFSLEHFSGNSAENGHGCAARQGLTARESPPFQCVSG